MSFVIGQWIRGHRFYGRADLIDEILYGERDHLWLLGTRRIGKTSLLRQVELLASREQPARYFAVVWDFQGGSTPKALTENLCDALWDCDERLEAVGISIEDLPEDDLFGCLSALYRRLRGKDLRLLLLCDEVEELLSIADTEPSFLGRLRHCFQSIEGIRSVLSSTIRLWGLSSVPGTTSNFLNGLEQPLFIRSLTKEDARSLVRQENLPPEKQPQFDPEIVDLICERCDCHPFLMQLLSKRMLESGNLREATDDVAADDLISHFFHDDFQMLPSLERSILQCVAQRSSSTSNSLLDEMNVDAPSLQAALRRLRNLGYLARQSRGNYTLANYFFRSWFDRQTLAPTQTGPTEPLKIIVDQRYQLVRELGRGSTGTVYKAYDNHLRSHIALKLLRRDFAENPAGMERIRKEICESQKVTHPHVLRIHYLGRDGDTHYLTMNLVEGGTLRDLIRNRAPLPTELTVTIGKKLASALAALHGLRLIHRDIKPQNILLDEGCEPCICDFGLVLFLGEPSIVEPGRFVGTPDYASPEQAAGEPLDARSDLYALGVVLFEMATGRRPFSAESGRETLRLHMAEPPPDPAEIGGTPRTLSDLILRCLAKSPRERYSNAEALLLALGSV